MRSPRSGSASPGAARAGARLAAVALLFLVSGCAGLIYEVLWTRSLTLVFGKTVHAASAVLAAYMAGLALGSATGGRLIDRLSGRLRGGPLIAYAALEVGIGLWALLLPLVLRAVTAVYTSIAAPYETPPASVGLLRFVLATAALMPATSMMGATLPVLSRWAVRRESEIGRRLGLLYALNTLGGVAGCLAAGFILLESVGVWGSTLAAAAGNFLVAGLGLALARRGEASAGAARGAAGSTEAAHRPTVGAVRRDGDLAPRAGLILVTAAVFLGGFAALALEIVWTRVLLLIFGTTSYSFSAMLAVFLSGIGLGSLAMTFVADRLRRPWLTLGLLQGGIGVVVLASLHLVDLLPGVYLRLLSWRGLTWSGETQTKFAIAVILLLPATLLSGAIWPVAVRLARPRGESLGAEVGRLYAANTAGSIAGSIAGGFALLPALGMQASLSAVALVMAALGALTVLVEPASLIRRAAAAAGVAAAASVLALTASPWDRKLLTSGAYFNPHSFLDHEGRLRLRERLKDTRLLFYAEGVATTPSVAILDDVNKAFFNDGKIEGGTALDGMRLQRLLGHLPLLLHAGEPAAALNIGLGSGITVGAMGVHSLSRLDCAEIEPAVVPAARLFDPETFHVLDRPGFRMIFNDGRNHLMLNDERYDAISSAPFAPLVGGAAALYTVEHFRLVRERLAPGGVAAQFVPLYQLAPEDFRSILKSFAAVFPEASLWFTGQEAVLVAGTSPLRIDFGRLAARVRQPEVAASLAEIGMDDPVRLLATFCFRVADVARDLEEIPLLTDDRPRLEFTAPRQHLVNTVRENLPWLLARRRSPGSLVDLPDAWEPSDPRRDRFRSRLEVGLEAQRLTMQGRLEGLRGELDLAIATLERAVAADPSDLYARDLAARHLTRLAGRLEDQGRAPEAIAAYERALRWDPRHFVSLLNLARALYARGDLAQARRLTEEALGQAPHSASLNYRMGLLLLNEGALAGAERSLRAALDADPTDPAPLMVLGDLERARGAPARASSMYAKAVELGKRDAEGYTALAGSLLEEGRGEEAAAWVDRALEASPADPETVLLRARLSLARGRREEARRDVAAAVSAGGERIRRLALRDPGLKELLE